MSFVEIMFSEFLIVFNFNVSSIIIGWWWVTLWKNVYVDNKELYCYDQISFGGKTFHFY